MKIIDKVELKRVSLQTIYIDPNAKIMHVGLDGVNKICLWALIDTESDPVPVEIAIYATGDNVPDNADYIVTINQPPYQWHVFEIVEDR